MKINDLELKTELKPCLEFNTNIYQSPIFNNWDIGDQTLGEVFNLFDFGAQNCWNLGQIPQKSP